MARTTEELRQQILRHGPWWLRDPEEVADAIFRDFVAMDERIEAAIETLFDRTFIGTADGAWLDEHGFERSRPRIPGELDDDYRLRIRGWPDAVTRPAILAAADAVLEVGTARMEEWLTEGPFACLSGTGDTSGFAGSCTAYSGRRGFTLWIERQVPDGNNTAFAIRANQSPETIESFAVQNTGDGVYPDDPGSFADAGTATPSAVYQRLIDVVNATKAAGVDYHVYIDDTD